MNDYAITSETDVAGKRKKGVRRKRKWKLRVRQVREARFQ